MWVRPPLYGTMPKRGSWLQDRPRALEWAYRLTAALILGWDRVFHRVGYERAARLLRPVEKLTKGILFGCRMCGQCILHSTGMTCPMTCPKELRNGPCGGVRSDGHCEVEPERACTWVLAYERSRLMRTYGDEMMCFQPPVDRRLAGTSAWINWLVNRRELGPME